MRTSEIKQIAMSIAKRRHGAKLPHIVNLGPEVGKERAEALLKRIASPAVKRKIAKAVGDERKKAE